MSNHLRGQFFVQLSDDIRVSPAYLTTLLHRVAGQLDKSFGETEVLETREGAVLRGKGWTCMITADPVGLRIYAAGAIAAVEPCWLVAGVCACVLGANRTRDAITGVEWSISDWNEAMQYEPWDLRRHVTLTGSAEGEGTLISLGMVKAGLPELEMQGVAFTSLEEARSLLYAVARQSLTAPLTDGQVLSLPGRSPCQVHTIGPHQRFRIVPVAAPPRTLLSLEGFFRLLEKH